MPLAKRVRFDAFELDTGTGELWKDGDQIHLQEKPFEVLMVLLERSGEVVSQSEFQERLWPDQAYLDFEHCIRVAVSKLREALGDSAGSPRFVETLPSRGYRFIAPLEGAPANGALRRFWWLWLSGAAAGLLFFVGIAGLVGTGRFSTDKGAIEAALLDPIESLAVLPFLNLSGNPGQEYMAEGMTESIIHELGRIQSVRVISWQSVARFKESSESLPAIAHKLEVDAVVIGSVRLTEDKILIRAQLLDVDPERHLWAETYEVSQGKLMDLEQRVAREIADQIAVRITPGEQRHLQRPQPVTLAAYDAHLKGLHAWNQFTRPGFESAIENFEHAIALDPGFAAPFAGLADAWTMLAWYGFVAPHDAFPRAESAAKRALKLDPNSARAHNSMAAVLGCYRWEFSAANAHHLKAIELNPSFALAHNWYSWTLAQQGSFEEALEEARKAQRLDPLSAPMNTAVGVRLYDARRYDQAIDQFHLTLEMNRKFLPAMLFLGMTYQRVGRHDEAIGVLQDAVTLSRGAPTFEAALAAALAAARRTEEAEAEIEKALAVPEPQNVPAFQVATAFTSLGDFDRAFEWLERAYELRAPTMGRIAIEPILDPLRDDPRLDDLRRRVGL